jgi:hypothetical protein
LQGTGVVEDSPTGVFTAGCLPLIYIPIIY